MFVLTLAPRSLALARAPCRRSLSEAKERDWADYIHYGSPDLSLKQFES